MHAFTLPCRYRRARPELLEMTDEDFFRTVVATLHREGGSTAKAEAALKEGRACLDFKAVARECGVV